MTNCLQIASNQTLKVEVVKQGFFRPSYHEVRLLKISPRQVALIREVVLYGRNEPWMLGRTVIPLTSLYGKAAYLKFVLNERPIGQILFSDPHLKRSEFELTQQLDADGSPIWLRRSIFSFRKYPILLTETFLPLLLAHCVNYEPLVSPS